MTRIVCSFCQVLWLVNFSTLILGESKNGKILCFVFLRQFFTIEYNPLEPTTSFYGYALVQQRIQGPKVQPIDILLDVDHSMAILTDVRIMY